MTLTIDGGGSGSRARLVDTQGVATTVHAGPLSLTNVTPADVRRGIEKLLDALPDLPAGIRCTVGLAGGGDSKRTSELADWLRHRLATEHVGVGRDIDLLLAQLSDEGAALVLGTGAVIVARGPNGEVVVDGHGFLFGDRGGGAWLALEALRAGLRELDLTGTAPPLLDALLAAAEISSPRRVAATLGAGAVLDAGRVAALAPVVLARPGDPLADSVLAPAVEHVVSGVWAALARSGAPAEAEIVAAGGLLDAPAIAERLQAALGPALRRVEPLDGWLPVARR